MYIDLALILLAFAILLTATVILAVRYTYRRVGLRWRNPFPLIERAPKRDLTIDDLDVEPADTEAIKYLRDLSRKWRVFQDVYLVQRDGTMQIDYLIVSRQGVFLIEAKNWSGTPVGNETDAL